MFDLDNSTFSYMAYDDNVVSNSFKWHARLIRTRRKKIEWIHLLARKGLLPIGVSC
jgi:hypothetical protein